jgi:hypothetical protein
MAKRDRQVVLVSGGSFSQVGILLASVAVLVGALFQL